MLYYNYVSEKYCISDIKDNNSRDITLAEAKLVLKDNDILKKLKEYLKYTLCRCSYSELAIGDYYTINTINSDRIYLKFKHNDYVLFNYTKQPNNIYKNCYKPSDNQLVKYIYIKKDIRFLGKRLIY